MEIGAIVSLVVVLGAFAAMPFLMGGGLFLQYYFNKRDRERKYPQQVPGYGTRMARCPFPMETVAAMMDDTVDAWVRIKKDDRKKTKKRLDHLGVEWLTGTKQEDGTVKRYIVDKWGRSIAGDHSGNDLRVVYLDTDELGNTAFCHELCHELKEMEGDPDGRHLDDSVWKELVREVKAKYR